MDNNEQNNNYEPACECCCDAPQQPPSAEKNVFTETMKDGMNKVFSGIKTAVIAIIAALVVSGCDKLPTVEKIETVSKLAGTSAAMVVNMTKIDEQSKAVIIEIMDRVSETVPQAGETFYDVWTPIAGVYVEKLVSDGKIDEAQGKIILACFGTACQGIDYIFDVKYPKAREYKNLVEAAIHGFIDGYKSVGAPGLKSSVETKYDKDVFEYLKKKAAL